MHRNSTFQILFLFTVYLLGSSVLVGCRPAELSEIDPTETEKVALPSLPPSATYEPILTPEPSPTLPGLPPTNTPIPTPTDLPPLTGRGGGVLAFVSERSGSPGIYVMNADGSDPRLLTDQYDTHPSWSPDGTMIAFSTRRADVVAIYSIDLATNKITQLTNTERAPSAPDWAPDGEKFAIIYNPSHPGINFEMYLMGANGKNFQRLTQSEGYQFYASPDWAPDGSRLAFAADLSGNYDIYLMDPDGAGVEKLTSAEANDNSPAWSPDGTKIAFETFRDGNWDIYLMNADGTDLKPLITDPADDKWPSWSPDGSQIAFQTDRDGNWEIYLMDLDGSNVTRLTENEFKNFEPAWRPN